MAKIVISGTTYSVISEITTEQLQKLGKYRPAALNLYEVDESGKKQQVFAVATTKPGCGVVNSFGACFDGTAFDGTGRACVTKSIPADVTDAKKYVADTVGMAIVKLSKVEEQVAPAMESIAADEAAVRDHIEIV